jgi:hypothetical protein
MTNHELLDKEENGKKISPVLPGHVKNFLIDIDGTICDDIPNEEPWRMSKAEVYPEALETINKWHNRAAAITTGSTTTSCARHVTTGSSPISWRNRRSFKSSNPKPTPMKKSLLLLFPVCLFLFSFAEKEPVLTVKITPLQDTILPGFDNMMEVFSDGVSITNIGYSMKFDGATMGPSFVRRGLYKVETFERKAQDVAVFTMMKDGKEVLRKEFIVPVMTPELKARATAAIEAAKTQK